MSTPETLTVRRRNLIGVIQRDFFNPSDEYSTAIVTDDDETETRIIDFDPSTWEILDYSVIGMSPELLAAALIDCGVDPDDASKQHIDSIVDGYEAGRLVKGK